MISLSPVDSLLAACLVLLVGRLLTSRIGFLARYSIPDPVVGGLLFAIGVFVLTNWVGIDVQMDTEIRSVFLLIFFSCVGLTANLRLLKRGGPRLIVFLIALLPFLFLQNMVGVGMAWLLDMHPLMGLLAGSITLVGGHGTGAAYAATFADSNNIQDVMALAMMAATIGLVMGGVVGGPVAEWLMRRHNIKTPLSTDGSGPHTGAPAAASSAVSDPVLADGTTPAGLDSAAQVQTPAHAVPTSAAGAPAVSRQSVAAPVQEGVPATTAPVHPEVQDMQTPLDSSSFIGSLASIFVCLAVGQMLAVYFADLPMSIPDFLWCLMTGVLIRNVGPLINVEPDDQTSDLLGTIALSLFLALSMMTIDLASAMQLAGPLAIILAVQTVVCIVFAGWAVFRIVRRDYEAAVISGAFCGFTLGSTATAIANMQAISRRHGHAPEAFIVVPITGAFLVDVMNVMVLTFFISLPFIGGF